MNLSTVALLLERLAFSKDDESNHAFVNGHRLTAQSLADWSQGVRDAAEFVRQLAVKEEV